VALGRADDIPVGNKHIGVARCGSIRVTVDRRILRESIGIRSRVVKVRVLELFLDQFQSALLVGDCKHQLPRVALVLGELATSHEEPAFADRHDA
jgi:hypothetical protein